MYGSIDNSKIEQDKKEVNFLKKCYRQILIFKFIAIILALFIILNWCLIFINNIHRYNQGKYVYNIISEVCKNIQEFKEKDNFFFAINTSSYLNRFYYKDGNFKEERNFHSPIEATNRLNYGKTIEDCTIVLNDYEDIKCLTATIYDDTIDKEYIFSNLFEHFNNLAEKDLMKLGKFSVTEKTVNSIECYVINGYIHSEELYEEHSLIIDKEEMLLIEYIYMDSKGDNFEARYEYQVGTVTDDDVKLKNFKDYYIDEEAQNYLNNF